MTEISICSDHKNIYFFGNFFLKNGISNFHISLPSNFVYMSSGKKVLVFLCFFCKSFTLRKVSKYGVSSGPYFPVFGPEKTPYIDSFHAVKWRMTMYLWYLSQHERTIKLNCFFNEIFVKEMLVDFLYYVTARKIY